MYFFYLAFVFTFSSCGLRSFAPLKVMPVIIAAVISSSLTCRCIGIGFGCFLVMEEANSREGHGDVVFVAGFNHMVVAKGATGLCHI